MISIRPPCRCGSAASIGRCGGPHLIKLRGVHQTNNALYFKGPITQNKVLHYRAGQCASRPGPHARMASTRKMRSGRAANALRSNSAARFSCAASNGCYVSLAQRAAVWLARWPLPEDFLCLFRYALFWVIGPNLITKRRRRCLRGKDFLAMHVVTSNHTDVAMAVSLR